MSLVLVIAVVALILNPSLASRVIDPCAYNKVEDACILNNRCTWCEGTDTLPFCLSESAASLLGSVKGMQFIVLAIQLFT
jgi:hypothetical protein